MPILRRLTADDAETYRAIRLEGLQSQPDAFGSSWAEEREKPLAAFAARLEGNAVWGGWLDRHADLAGVAGLAVPTSAKLRHIGTLWGMFVRPQARGQGLGAALVQTVIDDAATRVEELRLTVVATNPTAVRLYSRLGFQQYALDPRALKIDGRYYDEILMARRLRSTA